MRPEEIFLPSRDPSHQPNSLSLLYLKGADPGVAEIIKAARADTCGVAIDVPLRYPYVLPGFVL
jgi:hypothetical protein